MAGETESDAGHMTPGKWSGAHVLHYYKAICTYSYVAICNCMYLV